MPFIFHGRIVRWSTGCVLVDLECERKSEPRYERRNENVNQQWSWVDYECSSNVFSLLQRQGWQQSQGSAFDHSDNEGNGAASVTNARLFLFARREEASASDSDVALTTDGWWAGTCNLCSRFGVRLQTCTSSNNESERTSSRLGLRFRQSNYNPHFIHESFPRHVQVRRSSFAASFLKRKSRFSSFPAPSLVARTPESWGEKDLQTREKRDPALRRFLQLYFCFSY